jgi:hypothetical protein
MTSSSIHYLALFILLESLEIAYSVIAVDNMKSPMRTNAIEANVIFVTIIRFPRTRQITNPNLMPTPLQLTHKIRANEA